MNAFSLAVAFPLAPLPAANDCDPKAPRAATNPSVTARVLIFLVVTNRG